MPFTTHARRATTTLTLLTGLGFATSAMAVQWNFAEPYGDANLHTQNARAFAKDVSEATHGALDITVHANGALIPHPEIKNAVRRGIVPIGEIFLSRLANENPVYEIDALPTLVHDYPSAHALWEASRPEISALLAKQGLKVLYSVPWPSQGIYTQMELTSPAQLQGLRLRSNNTSTERLAELLGAIPTQTEASDIPTAFSTGRVNAMVTSVSTGANTAAWDYVSHFNNANLWLPRNIVFVSQKAFDRLNEDGQDAVMNAAAAAEKRGWAASEKESRTNLKTIEDHGIQVNTPTPELESALQQAGDTLLEQWSNRAGPEGKHILETYRSLTDQSH